MGDTRKTRKKYETPRHPWNKDRIDAERIIKRDYGLRNKKEIWKSDSLLKGIKDQIKALPSMDSEQAVVVEEKLRKRLKRIGLISENTPLGDVLGYDINTVLDRRLQTIVLKRGLARSPKQARQMIIHEHITVDGTTVNAPAYIVLKEEESTITFHSSSPFFRNDHPERIVEEQGQKVKKSKQNSAQEDVEVVELKEEDKDLE